MLNKKIYMLFKDLLQFNTKEALPNDFFGILCRDVCSSPVLKSEYFNGNFSCDDNAIF